MSFEGDDTRKVQTAVVGRAESDWPVFLPYDHDDFDSFMRGRTRDDFYCGTLLGGCGKKLTAKRYLGKKCHFAHRPPVHCRRTARDESSADHLYIGQAIRNWLERQKHHSVQVTYTDLGSGPGGIIDVRFRPGHRLIRVQMARQSPQGWQEARARLTDHHTRVHWAYGQDSGLAHHEVEAEGHAIRFSCRTEGRDRCVYVGTDLPDHRVKWVPLDTCHLNDLGIITPELDGRPSVTPVAFPLSPGSIAFTRTVNVPVSDASTHLYEAEVQPMGSAMVRARISLPQQCEVPLPHRLYLIGGAARLIPLTDFPSSGISWLIRAEGASPLPESTDPRWPDLRPAPRPASPRSRASDAGPSTAEALLPAEKRLVVRLREHLELVARGHSLIKWETLLKKQGMAVSAVTPEARVRLLAAVDEPYGPGTPVLSSLVKMAGQPNGPAPFFGDVLTQLGWKPNAATPTIQVAWRTERDRAYALVARKPPAKPARPTRPTGTGKSKWAVPGSSRSAVATAVRQALIDAARRQVCVGWITLAAAAGHSSDDFSDGTRIAILVEVDSRSAPDGLLLSSLVIAAGHTPVPYFNEVLRRLGRPHGLQPIALGRVRKVEQARVFAAYHPGGPGEPPGKG